MSKRRKKKEILKEISKRDIVSSKKCKNGTKIACVFSCPGQEEEKTREYLSGTTGENLERLLSILNWMNPNIFVSTDKKDYFLVNSSEHVYYKGYISNSDKRTTPYAYDIRSSENINRLQGELSNFAWVIAFGRNAEMALVESKISFIRAKCHIGDKGLTSLPNMKKEDKLMYIALDIMCQINRVRLL